MDIIDYVIEKSKFNVSLVAIHDSRVLKIYRTFPPHVMILNDTYDGLTAPYIV